MRVVGSSTRVFISMSSSGAKSTKTEQSLFEEDDEFEEFPTEGASQQFLLLAPINAH